MTEESSNLFQDDQMAFEENLETDMVGLMTIEDQKALKKRILRNIKTGIQKHEQKRNNRRRIFTYTKIAASVLIVLAINGALWTTLKLEKHTYQTGSNETLKIELPDGSTALLNSNSSLTYTYNMAFGFDRKVELIGEAYFEIAKDAESKRFVINEGDVMEVEVFGTEFNFKNQNPIHKLTLIQGSVKLGYQSEQGNTNRMVLPGETIKLDVENHQLEAKTVADPIKLLAWQDRKIRMQNESLEEVLSIVAELYDLELVDQTLPTNYQLISGSLPLTDNPNEVIENIEVLFDTEIHLEQNSIRVQ
ncbi:FecR family protein [Algoriphagus aquimarinus]|uniref:Ferric-dicitrate binding protein FerR, regulates iron transport through sigma-19 n=1 Tax=Algoriphagus aquimarinus TaxID=237018 RepID=A0A1I1BZI9_9BACT|nr:FecR domain-containing protein [Algoriphagus aquimarinus]SFB53960.1 ferric-dicitrate binding protein FerR, regulates iron transport through sigma-19 [Algoriphagus aquimarinus]